MTEQFHKARKREDVKKEDVVRMKNVLGHTEQRDKVLVLVQKKLTPQTLVNKASDKKDPFTLADIIPERVRTGFLGMKKKPTDVIDVGYVKAHADRKKYRPLKAGSEIGIFKWKYIGTLGMFVNIKRFRDLRLVGPFYDFMKLLEHFGIKAFDVPAVLTNSHVANRSVIRPRAEIITQPGFSYYSNQIIGASIHSSTIQPGRRNWVDAALIELDSVTASDGIMEVGSITGFDDVQDGDEVEKRGRTTEYTEGRCIAKNIYLYIDFHDDGRMIFDGIDMFTGMSGPGDSGSVIVRKSDKKAVSLLFAGSGTHTFGIPINRVKKVMKFDMIK